MEWPRPGAASRYMAQRDMSDHIQVRALVGPGSNNNSRYSFSIGNWTIADSLVILSCTSDFAPQFDHKNVASQMLELERILIAMFLSDHIPRAIFCFDYKVDPSNRDGMFYSQLFGNPRNSLRDNDQQMLPTAFMQTGWIFNHKPGESSDSLPSLETIQDWYTLLTNHPHLLSSLTLIKESFRRINLLYGQYRYGDHIDFLQAFLLLISGLESVFFYGFDDHADITFKFQVVGAAMYSKFVNQSFLDRFGTGEREVQKLSYGDFKQLLKYLYSFRSKIAHGSVYNILEERESFNRWNKMIQILGVGKIETGSPTQLRQHIMLALGLMQRHILAMFVGARERILKAPEVFDEVVSKGAI